MKTVSSLLLATITLWTAWSASPVSDAAPAFKVNTISERLMSNQQYTISVLGDSTSEVADGWVYLLSRRIAQSYNKAVVVRDWDSTTNTYSPDRTYGTPVTVWNGSARGKDARYAVERFDQLAPAPADLTIINHTHNNPWGAVTEISKLVDLAEANSKPGGGVVVTLQNPRVDSADRALLEQQVIDGLRAAYGSPESGVIVADVNAAFRAGDLSELLSQDGLHPSKDGSELWANTLASTLMLG